MVVGPLPNFEAGAPALYFSGRYLSLVKISSETLTAEGMSSAASLPFLGSAYRKTSEAECGDSRRSAKQPLP
jgi:hypothetical protein